MNIFYKIINKIYHFYFKHFKGKGYIPLPKQKIDPRDWVFSSSADPYSLPTKVDQRNVCGDVLDQKTTNSCTGFAMASIIDSAYTKTFPLLDQKRVASPLYAYWYARRAQAWTTQDKGAYIFDVVKETAKRGIAPEKLHPFTKGVFTPPDDYAEGYAQFTKIIKSYRKITDANGNNTTVDDIRKALADNPNNRVEGGVLLYPQFFEPTFGGVVEIPTEKDMYNGAHAIHICGYVDVTKEIYDKALTGEIGLETIMSTPAETYTGYGFFLFKNSWGTRYGKGGYALLPYVYVDKHANDVWVCEIIPQ